jgi:2'-5' RNA ligase/uncharacterized protein (UPF0248 family)
MASTSIVENAEFIEKNITNIKSHFKTYYPEQVALKVLANVGEIPYVVKFNHQSVADINVTLQILGDYDLKSATLIVSEIKQNKYDGGKLAELKETLAEVLRDDQKHNFSDSVLIEFFTKALEFIDDNFMLKPKRLRKEKKQQQKDHKSKGKSSGSDEDVSKSPEKKCSMKTAGDVVHRIQWDTEINQDHVIVGYLDRFLGLKECLFSTFDWGDIVLADIGALAIPEHRINYFKYKGEVVWDKNIRLDNVFGSTGSNKTIYDVIKQLAATEYVPELEEKEEVNKLGRVKHSNNVAPQVKKNDYSNTQSDEPNYFISIPITNAEVRRNFAKFTAELAESNADVHNFILPASSLHLTVCTLRINNSEELSLVKSIMESFELDKDLAREFLSIDFKFQGIGEFYDKVVFVKCAIEKIEKLKELRNMLLERIENSGMSVAGNYYDFVPHLTVMKISQSSIKSLSYSTAGKTLNVSDFVSKELVSKYDQSCFGEQRLDQLELCKMVNIFSFKTYPVEFTVKLN